MKNLTASLTAKLTKLKDSRMTPPLPRIVARKLLPQLKIFWSTFLTYQGLNAILIKLWLSLLALTPVFQIGFRTVDLGLIPNLNC